jgi:putative SOS response-associated peptidase YedK
MCGKFTQQVTWEQIVHYSNLLQAPVGGSGLVTPMRQGRVIALDDAGKRRNAPMRWGWPDRRPKANINIPRFMHAKSETIDVLPTFAESFRKRRGIVAVSGFNFGQEVTSKKVIQHVVTPNDGKPLGIAVIYDRFAVPDGAEFLAFVMVTAAPNPAIGELTDRMPAILPPESWARWLGEEHEASLADVRAVLGTQPGDWDIREQQKPPRPARL